MLDLKTMTMSQLTLEFLRRVVIELKGRHFDFVETALCVPPEGNYGDMVSAAGNATDILKCLPELTREFANKIKPEFTRCYKLPASAQLMHHYFAYDPISGLNIRCLRHWDVMHGEIMYRFDAAFN